MTLFLVNGRLGPYPAFIQHIFNVHLLCARHSCRHCKDSRDLKNHIAQGIAVFILILGGSEELTIGPPTHPSQIDQGVLSNSWESLVLEADIGVSSQAALLGLFLQRFFIQNSLHSRAPPSSASPPGWRGQYLVAVGGSQRI